MNTPEKISEICNHIKSAGDRLSNLTFSIERIGEGDSDGLYGILEEQRFNELEHLQILMLSLTDLITGEPETTANIDEGGGSVFAEGDLTDNLGDKTDCSTEESKK